jgi:hypothetical protein
MKYLVILFAFSINFSFAQDKNENMNEKYYSRCFDNLKPIQKSENFPNFDPNILCSLRICFGLLRYEETNIIIKQRLIDLANKFYAEGIVLKLVTGKESVQYANEKNKNLEDDDKLIYISIFDNIDWIEIAKAIETYNSETQRLINNR